MNFGTIISLIVNALRAALGYVASDPQRAASILGMLVSFLERIAPPSTDGAATTQHGPVVGASHVVQVPHGTPVAPKVHTPDEAVAWLESANASGAIRGREPNG